ncbi:MAG: hypothetical protein WCY68_13950 [Desulfuromonadales bacterium]
MREKSNSKHEQTAVLMKALNDRLSSKIDGVEANLTAKIDAVAVDLGAHRKNTEAHGRCGGVPEFRGQRTFVPRTFPENPSATRKRGRNA